MQLYVSESAANETIICCISRQRALCSCRLHGEPGNNSVGDTVVTASLLAAACKFPSTAATTAAAGLRAVGAPARRADPEPARMLRLALPAPSSGAGTNETRLLVLRKPATALPTAIAVAALRLPKSSVHGPPVATLLPSGLLPRPGVRALAPALAVAVAVAVAVPPCLRNLLTRTTARRAAAGARLR